MLNHQRSRRSQERVRSERHRWRFWLLVALGLGFAAVAASVAWVGFRAQQLRPVASQLVAQAAALRDQAAAGDANAVAKTLTQLRASSSQAADLCSGPAWALTAHLPVMGDDVRAARALTTTARELTQSTEPLETALPELAGSSAKVNVAALRQVNAALPGLSTTVDDGIDRLQDVGGAGVTPQLDEGVTSARSMLESVQAPLHTAKSTMPVFANLLGAAGPRSYAVLLQQDAEARGTGGLIGAYAVIGANDGDLSMKSASQRGDLGAGAKIPITTLPTSLQDLWGSDLKEWAGLNLSPHFPWTGELVTAGWAAQKRPAIDGVIAIDQHAVAGLLQATGPISVDGVRLSSDNAVPFLSRDIYAKFPDHRTVDAVTGKLVQAMFARLTDGDISPTALVRSLAKPVNEHRVLVWSAKPSEQQVIADTPLGGVLPDNPGPFLMAVINNGGGNKLDAYLKTTINYDPGTCTNGVRIGSGRITLTSTAPAQGLPDYVNGKPGATPAARTLLDIYAPVGASPAGILIDGQDADIITNGTDRNHPVWRVAVTLKPGQTQIIEVGIAQPTTDADSPTATVPVQPLVNPASVEVKQPAVCT